MVINIKQRKTMEKHVLIISPEVQYEFQVGQYPHHSSRGCKYKIYLEEKLVASLEPYGRGFLHVCQNVGNIDMEILHLLAEQIEVHHPTSIQLGELENIEFDGDDELEPPPQNN
jgi:hypothetical protein